MCQVVHSKERQTTTAPLHDEAHKQQDLNTIKSQDDTTTTTDYAKPAAAAISQDAIVDAAAQEIADKKEMLGLDHDDASRSTISTIPPPPPSSGLVRQDATTRRPGRSQSLPGAFSVRSVHGTMTMIPACQEEEEEQTVHSNPQQEQQEQVPPQDPQDSATLPTMTSLSPEATTATDDQSAPTATTTPVAMPLQAQVVVHPYAVVADNHNNENDNHNNNNGSRRPSHHKYDDDEDKVGCYIALPRFCGKRWFWIFLVLVGLVMLIAAGVVVGLFVIQGNSDNNSNEATPDNKNQDITTFPSPAITLPPTPSPTYSSPPSLTPSLRPSVTVMPSATPTLSSRFTTIRDLLSNISNPLDLADATLPQGQALQWLVWDDPRQVVESASNELRFRYLAALLYFATNGRDWDLQWDFLKATSVCEWNEGRIRPTLSSIVRGWFCIEGDKDGAPEIVVLDSNNLQGTLPTELGFLSTLETFSVFNNGLVGTIPTELQNLINIGILRLDSNALTGTIPPSVLQMPMLRVIYCNNNALTGTIPTQLGTQLERLSLRNNPDLSGPIPTAIGNATLLQQLELSHCGLTGTIPTELGMLVNLERLWLHRNGLTGAIPRTLGRLVDLESLTLEANAGLTGPIPTELVQLIRLQTFRVQQTQVTGNLDPIFCFRSNLLGPIPQLEADCGGNPPEVVCNCCTACGP